MALSQDRHCTFHVILFLLFCSLTISAQQPDLADKMDQRRFVADMQTVNPQRGVTRTLSSGYQIIIKPDTIQADLPYFGRAYQAQYNPSDAGVKFTSVDFNYSVKEKRKGGWEVRIKPKDVSRYSQLYMTVSSSGSVILRVIPTDRESISYAGAIRMER